MYPPNHLLQALFSVKVYIYSAYLQPVPTISNAPLCQEPLQCGTTCLQTVYLVVVTQHLRSTYYFSLICSICIVLYTQWVNYILTLILNAICVSFA